MDAAPREDQLRGEEVEVAVRRLGRQVRPVVLLHQAVREGRVDAAVDVAGRAPEVGVRAGGGRRRGDEEARPSTPRLM